jgi:hypothetical protein
MAHLVCHRPAMNESSQNDSAVQGQKRPVTSSGKMREVRRLKLLDFPLLSLHAVV